MTGTTLAVEKLKTCHDCKKQDVESSFPKQKNKKGEYTAMNRCAPCLATFRMRYRTPAEKSLYKICRTCKKQDLYDSFPKHKNSLYGTHYALPNCAECHAKQRQHYRVTHQGEIKKYSKQWIALHPTYKKQYRQRLSTQFNEQLNRYLRNAQEARRDVDLTTEEFHALFEGSCYYCGQETELKLNGIDRLNAQLGHIPTNVVSCCTTCNFMKQSLTKEEFLERVKRIILHMNLLTSVNHG